MEILQLKYFYESAKSESFAKTAEQYMVPITSVSASIKRLEKELGCSLFERYPNRISLNENGKKLQNSLFMIFGELDSVVNSLSPAAENLREIKILVRAMRSDITELIIEFKSLYPTILFKTYFDFNTDNFDDYDIIIDDDPDKHFDCDYFEYTSRRLVLKASCESPLCKQDLHLKDLCNQSFVSMGEHTSTHKLLLKACKSEGFTPDIVAYTNDLKCYDRYIEAGIGIGVARYNHEAIYSDKISYLNVVDFIARQTVYVFFKRETDTGNLQRFLDFVKNKVSENNKKDYSQE